MNFSEARLKYRSKYLQESELNRSFVTIDGNFINNISIKDVNNKPNEEFYKWEFIYSLITSEMYSRDYIGCEIYFPKGNISSAPIKIDAVIFDSIEWLDIYKDYRKNKNQDALHKLRNMAIAMIEFKRDGDDKKIEQIFSSQIKATIKESDSVFTLGIYYNFGRLYLFKKDSTSAITRYDNGKNFPKSQRILEQYQLELTDPYYMIPSFHDLMNKIKGIDIESTQLTIKDLDVVDKISDENIRNSLNQILRQLTEDSLYNEEGYMLLIQLIALKIYDENESERYGSNLKFHITNDEIMINDNLTNKTVQTFITRFKELFSLAKRQYKNILDQHEIAWTNKRHIRAAQTIVKEFQRYSFKRSRRGDLYQLVFYNFATKFKKDENAQFLTPIPIINFMVDIVNPKRRETVCDPCCGIADFLSISYINSDFQLNDNNLYGLDNDYNMTVLAQLNMLLNGDGNANIYYVEDKGSIDKKLNILGRCCAT